MIRVPGSKRENINQHVQMYASILSDILLNQHIAPHLVDVREAIIKVNTLIFDHPNTRGYKDLKKELLHLKNLVSSLKEQ